LNEDKKINNPGMVINGADFTKYLGYNYGYNNDEVEKKLWYKKSVFRKLFSNQS